jgi:cell wall-associated NlpC family hydrolase
MTREFDDSRHCPSEHQGLTWDRVNSEEQYQRTNYNYGNPGVSAGISFDIGGAQVNIGTGNRGGYGGHGYGSSDRYYQGNYGSNDGYGADYGYQPRYNGEAYRTNDDRYVIRINGQNQDLYAGDQYFGPSNSSGAYQTGSQYDRYNSDPSQNDRYLVNQRYSGSHNYQNDYYVPQQGMDSRSGYYINDYGQREMYQPNRFSLDRYNQDQYDQYRYPNGQYDQSYSWQDRYAQDQYSQNRFQKYRYSNDQDDQYNRYDQYGQSDRYYQNNRYGQQNRYGLNGYQSDHSDDWSRMRVTLQAMLGHSPQEFNRNVPNDLGCATIVSAALRQAHGVRINDTNVNGLENSLRHNGYRAVPVQYAQPGDCIIAHRAGNRPGHAAIYVGDGKVVNNSSQQGRVVVASLNKFASSDYQSVVAYRRA